MATEAPGVYIIYSIDDSVENSMGGRPYPRTEAPGAETPEIINDSIENSRGEVMDRSSWFINS